MNGEHEHHWRLATILSHQAQHPITNAQTVRPSILMLCICGLQRHEWVIEPSEVAVEQPKVKLA